MLKSYEVRMRKKKRGWETSEKALGLWKPHSQTGFIHIKSAVRQDKDDKEASTEQAFAIQHYKDLTQNLCVSVPHFPAARSSLYLPATLS